MPERVDYGSIAPGYDQRYVDQPYAGIEDALLRFARGGTRVLEVGCGTGQWLARLTREGLTVAGLDASRAMLAHARGRAPHAALACGRAEALPFANASFDRLCCVHALHHFEDRDAFFAEARRVLRPGGALCILGLDPHTGHERWWIYDFYPDALAVDRARFPAPAALREQLAAHGFTQIVSREAERLQPSGVASEALSNGKLGKGVTSQLALMSDADYEAGIARLQRAIDAAAARGETLRLETDLRIVATIAHAPE